MDTRFPAYSGSFYPAEKKELSSMVEKFVSEAETLIPKKAKLKALVIPHAGYIYSGKTAGYAYKALEQAVPSPKKIVLFGPSHHEYIEKIYGFEGKWITPLGEQKIVKHSLPIIKGDNEHCLEVQLPFLQTALKKFEFLPLLYGEITSQRLAAMLDSSVKKENLLIASSDLSHFFPYEKAKETDAETIESVLSLDLEKFLRIGDACGKTGIGSLIILAKKHGWKPMLLDYRNSGDTAGEKNRVVGYAAIAFIEETQKKRQ